MEPRAENRLRTLESEVSLLRRELAQLTGRIGNPLAPRQGIVLAALTAELAQGGSATAKVIGFDLTDWFYPDVDQITVWDFWLNVDKTIPVDTKIVAFWYRNAWVVLTAYCAASDTLPAEA